jgi:hypothetical protein
MTGRNKMRVDDGTQGNSWPPPLGITVLLILYFCFAGNAFYWQFQAPEFSPWLNYLGGYWLVLALLFFMRLKFIWTLLRAIAYVQAWLWAFSIIMSLGVFLSLLPAPPSMLAALAAIYLSQILTIVVLLGARGYLNEPIGRAYFGMPARSES